MTYEILYYASCYLALAILLFCLVWAHRRKPFPFGENLTFPDITNCKASQLAPPEDDATDGATPMKPNSEWRPRT